MINLVIAQILSQNNCLLRILRLVSFEFESQDILNYYAFAETKIQQQQDNNSGADGTASLAENV